MVDHNIIMQRNKPLNSVQKQILFKNVEANPDAADSINKSEHHKQFWERLAKELNNVGPPIKAISEWRKAWRDQKRYMSRRATTHQKLFEDGCILSSDENTSVNFFDVGVENSDEECMPHYNNIDLAAQNELSEEQYTKSINNHTHFEPKIDLTNEDSNSSNYEETEQPVQNNTEKEDNIPQYSLENLNTLHNEVLSNTNSIKNSLDRMFEEMQRHNLEMENLKKIEIEFKMKKFQKIVELQERKLQRSKKNN
ncbi:uncharacterized protein LOC119671103 [Teleopsis dalmanni]|uniref:uncharacterized protein LOC119671103 n=1 Tax=Teleopsis dalmanni TaxID=139649 RepID=UPI0018CD790A|nr:uncharacterized protein LOC119671103 [Teleopsis dalmanni]